MIDGTHGLRTEVLDLLSDGELAFSPGGLNLTFGGLIRELGEVEHSYIESLKTFKQDWTYRNTEAGIQADLKRLREWLSELDAGFKAAVSALSEEDLEKKVDRGFQIGVELQLQVYLQALLIFLGKATIFLRAMRKPLPKNLLAWIG